MKKVDGVYVCPDKHGMRFVGVIRYEGGTFTAMFECSDRLCGYQDEVKIPASIADLLESLEILRKES